MKLLWRCLQTILHMPEQRNPLNLHAKIALCPWPDPNSFPQLIVLSCSLARVCEGISELGNSLDQQEGAAQRPFIDKSCIAASTIICVLVSSVHEP